MSLFPSSTHRCSRRLPASLAASVPLHNSLHAKHTKEVLRLATQHLQAGQELFRYSVLPACYAVPCHAIPCHALLCQSKHRRTCPSRFSKPHACDTAGRRAHAVQQQPLLSRASRAQRVAHPAAALRACAPGQLPVPLAFAGPHTGWLGAAAKAHPQAGLPAALASGLVPEPASLGRLRGAMQM